MKKILLLILLLCVIIFGYKTFFPDNKLYKEKLKQLEEANKKLQQEKAVIDLKINSLKSEYDKLKNHEKQLAAEIDERDKKIAKDKVAAARSKAELDKSKKEIAEIQKKIAEMKEKPANRTGDDLLNSLKIKTQTR